MQQLKHTHSSTCHDTTGASSMLYTLNPAVLGTRHAASSRMTHLVVDVSHADAANAYPRAQPAAHAAPYSTIDALYAAAANAALEPHTLHCVPRHKHAQLVFETSYDFSSNSRHLPCRRCVAR
jgi:hypothetical protein